MVKIRTAPRKKLSGAILDKLKRRIVQGKLRPGDEMPSERELMVQHGVGRPAIREAMQALSAMGLVSISHGERAKVLELTAQSILAQVDQTAHVMLSRSSDTLEHLKDARIFFERGMVREAAEKSTSQQIDGLRKTLDRQRALLGKAEPFIAADMRFHTQIAEISGNPIYISVSEAMLGWLKVYHNEMLIWTGKEKHTLAEHESILNRIAAHDADGAETALVKHLQRSSSLYGLGRTSKT